MTLLTCSRMLYVDAKSPYCQRGRFSLTSFIKPYRRRAGRPASVILFPVSQQHKHKAIYHAGRRAGDRHLPGDGKHLHHGPRDEPLRAEFHGGGGHGVGEARDGYQGPRAAEPGQPVVDPQAREQGAEENEADADGGPRLLLPQPEGELEEAQQLAQEADVAPGHEGPGKVAQEGGGGRPLTQKCPLSARGR